MQSVLSENRNPTNAAQYEQARDLARRKRVEFGIQTRDVDIPLLKRICKQEKIKVDLKEKIGTRIRAAYFFDEDGASILLKKDLPREPKMFALVHELKHHFLDREAIADGKMQCGAYNENKVTEIAAEEFAAEFLYPAVEMQQMVNTMNIHAGSCTPEQVVEIKHKNPIAVSYIFICKRLERFGIIEKGQFNAIQFRNLEERLYPPFYKEPWYQGVRARKKIMKNFQ